MGEEGLDQILTGELGETVQEQPTRGWEAENHIRRLLREDRGGRRPKTPVSD